MRPAKGYGLVLFLAWLTLAGGAGDTQTARVSLESLSESDRSTPAKAERSGTSIRVNSDLVLIPVTVLDRRDGFVAGLEKEHFRLFEDKVEQAITHFASEDAPISVGFVIDASASMGGKIHKARESVARFLKTANPNDEFFLVQFNDRVELLTGMTRQTEEIKNGTMWVRPTGRTALLDAIQFSILQMRQARHPRKALIILSDGGDNNSRCTMSEVKNLVRETDVQIYSMGVFEPFIVRARTPEEVLGPALLREISEQTGGKLFDIDDPGELPDVASKISMALRNQYVLGYAPVNSQHDGKYHSVHVKLMPPKGFPRLHTSWRRGFYAPVE